MEQRINLRYEEPLKKLIIAMLENGELKSIQDAKRKFSIGGNTTVQKWLKKYDKEYLRPMRANKTLELELEMFSVTSKGNKKSCPYLISGQLRKVRYEKITSVSSFFLLL